MTTSPASSASSQQAAVDAALLVLKSMGLSLDDLTVALATGRPVPTFAEYVPVVSPPARCTSPESLNVLARQIHTWLSRTASVIGSPRQVERLRWTQRTIAVLSYRCTSTSVVSIDR